MHNYQGYLEFREADGSTSYICPYTDQGIEEDQDSVIARDHLHPHSSASNHSLGRMRYAGAITFPLCLEMVGFLKSWFVTDRHDAVPYRQIAIDNGWRKYRYTRMYPSSWRISCATEGYVECSIEVLGRGEEADTRQRKVETSIPVNYPRNPINYAPIPWHKVRLEGSGNYAFDSDDVISWSVTIANNYRETVTGDRPYVSKYFDKGNMETEGDLVLYHPTFVGATDPLFPFQIELSVSQTLVDTPRADQLEEEEPITYQQLADPVVWLTFPRVVPSTAGPDANGARRELRTRTIDWTGERNDTYLAVY